MNGLLSTGFEDSTKGIDSFNYFDKNPEAEVEERVITTPEGPQDITTVRKHFPNKNLQGIYIPDIDLTAENKELMHPWLYVRMHEDDHKRFESFYTSGSSIVDEFTNRRVADTHYNRLARKHNLPLVDTAGDLEKQLREYLKKNSTPDEIEQTMRDVKRVSDFDYQRVIRMPIDVEGDYKNEIPHRDPLTGEFATPKHSPSKLNEKLSYLV